MTAFPRVILGGDIETTARRLLGALLVRGTGPEARAGRIVEVEAYVGEDDLASHARFGRTGRNAAMFGPPGVAYVYLVYGMYYCLNVVTEPPGRPAALLIRAVEPLAGVDSMRAARMDRAVRRSRRRGEEAVDRTRHSLERMPAERLAGGPGLVCDAFSIDGTDDGLDLCDAASPLRLEIAAGGVPRPVEAGPRIGIDYAPEPWRSRPWRFFVPGSPSLSTGPRRGPGRREP
ncbi:MAG: DNA-3-methyladenine glycosylase [Candidatus Limnocylindrales bacterium]|jgi:DNA-3-methyladenine glycosylase